MYNRKAQNHIPAYEIYLKHINNHISRASTPQIRYVSYIVLSTSWPEVLWLEEAIDSKEYES